MRTLPHIWHFWADGIINAKLTTIWRKLGVILGFVLLYDAMIAGWIKNDMEVLCETEMTAFDTKCRHFGREICVFGMYDMLAYN